MLSQAELKTNVKKTLSPLSTSLYGRILDTVALAPINRLVCRNVAARMDGRTQVELAAHMKRTEAWASGFLNEKNAVPVSALAGLAEFAHCTVADLFQPVRETPTLTGHVTPRASNDASNPQPGDASDAVEAGLLRARTLALENENAALRAALDALADEYKTLAAVVRPRKAAVRKSTPRRNS